MRRARIYTKRKFIKRHYRPQRWPLHSEQQGKKHNITTDTDTSSDQYS